MTEHFFFLIGLCFLLTHEMDAIRCKEWRIFFAPSKIGDEAGYAIFTALHIPLYVLLLWGLIGDGASRGLIYGLDMFFVVHVFLHIIFVKHPEYRFRSVFSWSLILGAGASGAADLLSS